MNETNFKNLYTKSLQGHEGLYHFAAHSHHLWPDISLEGHQQAWMDASLKSDKKWDKIFSEVIPDVQNLIAEILSLEHPKRIVFAPNTHELVNRVLSLFPSDKEINILTTTSEFYSFHRQILRLEEDNRTHVMRINTSQIFEDRNKWVTQFIEQIKTGKYDLVFLSQVFFDSGFAFTEAELELMVNAKPAHTIFVLDGYHGFCALPYNLSKLEGKIFFLAGGYKYAQAGEGVCFMVVPPGNWRPANTGWFASFTTLHQAASEKVGYGEDASAFWGGTFDPTGLYRFRSVWNHFKKLELTVAKIHQHVEFLQSVTLREYGPEHTTALYDPSMLLDWHGHFLAFEAETEELASSLSLKLLQNKIFHDRRGRRIRIGYGLYHDANDVVYLIKNLCL